jgi:hypothetical protein
MKNKSLNAQVGLKHTIVVQTIQEACSRKDIPNSVIEGLICQLDAAGIKKQNQS